MVGCVSRLSSVLEVPARAYPSGESVCTDENTRGAYEKE
jgi:hypothetical protein